MSTLLDQESVVLEALDFDVPCRDDQTPEHPATVVMICRTCRHEIFICDEHLEALRRRYMPYRRYRAVHKCGAKSDTLDGLVEVVPL